MTEIESTQVPASLREVLELIGLPATQSLVRHYGGGQLYVPANVAQGDMLAAVVGLHKARLLADRFRLEQLEIPRCAGWLRAVRDSELRTRYAAGETQHALAREYGLTTRRVRSIISAD